MQFKCPKCSGVVSIDAENLGKTVSCGHCNEVVTAPAGAFDSGMIINDFIIQKELGFGGMGIVYLAQQITLDRPVALKILKDKYASDSEFVEQFVREARAAAKLNHPGIVQAYAVGEENGVYFFAMEYVDGDTMKDILAKEKKIKPEIAAKIISDIASALDYAWTENKIVHHDIKPDNIMLKKNGRAKLADLGLAGIFGDSVVDDDDDEVLGTPQYISPEQLLGEPTDVRSDIYSLGATFYHLITGEFPYNGKNATEIAHQHVNGTLIPPGQRDKSVPAALNDIIVKMMEKDITKRYQNASDIVADLEKYLAAPEAVPASDAGKNVQTASAPIGNRLKLSIGGATKAPSVPAKTPAAPVAPASSAPPKVQLNPPSTKPVVNGGVPKIQLNNPNAKTAVTGNVPKIQLNNSAVTPPAVQMPASAVAAVPKVEPVVPKLGLKKDKENVKEKASADAEKIEKAVSAIPKAVNKGKEAKKSGESKESNNAKKKKAAKTGTSSSLKSFILVMLVLLLACGGGVTWYLYKNKWKAPIIDQIKEWNKKREEDAKKIVHRIPVKPKKEPTIQELRKDYVPQIEAIKDFLKNNPGAGKEFLQKVRKFIHDNGTPELENEKEPFAQMIALTHIEDEKVWMASARSKVAATHSSEINKRIQTEKNRIAEEARIQAERKAEAQRRAAMQRAENERRKKEIEDKRKQEQRLAEYRKKIAPVYPLLSKLFIEALSNEKKGEELRRKVENLFLDYNPDGIQMQLHNQLDSYGKRLLAALPRTSKMYKFMTENRNIYKGHFIVLPRYNQVEILDVDFANHQFVVRGIISDKVSKISMNNAQMRKRLFNMFIKKTTKEPDIKYLQFYYDLFFGKLEDAAKNDYPMPIWKEIFSYIL